MAQVLLKHNNLFREGRIIVDDFDQRMLERDLVVFVESSNNKYHIITEFDRLDLLAYKYYNNIVEDSSKYWWLIADVNQIRNPLDLSLLVGQRIIIPDLNRHLLE